MTYSGGYLSFLGEFYWRVDELRFRVLDEWNPGCVSVSLRVPESFMPPQVTGSAVEAQTPEERLAESEAWLKRYDKHVSILRDLVQSGQPVTGDKFYG
jgi:hypothetical protein